MKTRPKKLVILSVFLFLLACSFPMQVMALYGHSPLEIDSIAGKLAPLNWAVMGLAPVTAWLAYRASPWLLGALPGLTVIVFYNNWLVGSAASDYSPAMAALGSVGFVAGLAALLNRESLQVILNPASRWWLTPLRRRLAVPVRFKLLSRGRSTRKSHEAFDEFYVRTYDLSEGGAFIPTEQISRNSGEAGQPQQIFGTILKNLAVGTQCYICLPLKDVHFIQCRAEIVRNTAGRGDYPAGVGIRFLGLSRLEKRRLNQYLESQAAQQGPSQALAPPSSSSGPSAAA